MNIHEYQAKALLAEYGVPVLKGRVAYTPEEAEAAARELGGPVWVVKAQIHAGGRGKGGGVKLARSVGEVRQLAGEMLGMTLVTHQTGPAGADRQAGLRRGRLRHRPRALPRRGHRPHDLARHAHGLDRGRRRDRGGRRSIPREDPARSPSTRSTGFMPYHGRQLALRARA